MKLFNSVFLHFILCVLLFDLASAWWFFGSDSDEEIEDPTVPSNISEANATDATPGLIIDPTFNPDLSVDNTEENASHRPPDPIDPIRPTDIDKDIEPLPIGLTQDNSSESSEEIETGSNVYVKTKIEQTVITNLVSDCTKEQIRNQELRETTICDGVSTDIKCCLGQKIHIQSAVYGRNSKLKLCTTLETHLGWDCKGTTDEKAKETLSTLCNGNFQCSIKPKLMFESDVDECPEVSKYLIVQFHCLNSTEADLVPLYYQEHNAVVELASNTSNDTLVVAGQSNNLVAVGVIKNGNVDEVEATTIPLLSFEGEMAEKNDSDGKSLFDKAKDGISSGIDSVKNAVTGKGGNGACQSIPSYVSLIFGFLGSLYIVLWN